MNYSEAMAFLEETKKYGSILGLDSIRRLMNEFDNVQDELSIVHITGTNGKGSVGAFLSSICVESGIRTGRFNTPDVFCYEDEFLINGEHISQDELANIYTDIAAACKKIVADGYPHPTRFEIETAAAFIWFYREKVDIALVEVGMGGATDATNLIKAPVLSLITAISMDHMGFLGNSLEEITTVKSGIIKPGCPVLSVVQPEEAAIVIEKTAKANDSRLTISDKSRAENIDFSFDGVRFSLDGNDYHAGLIGEHQLENAVCAIDAANLLKERYPVISDAAIKRGLANVSWPGRFEIIGREPLFIIDGAHNHAAAIALRGSLDKLLSSVKKVYVMGILADKEFEKVIDTMFEAGDEVFTVTPPNPRAFDADELAKILDERNINAVSCTNYKDAVSYALQRAGKEGAVIAFGSLYALKEIKEAAK